MLPFKVIRHDRSSFCNLLEYMIDEIGVKKTLFSEKMQMTGPITMAEQPRIDFVISGVKHLRYPCNGKITDEYMSAGTTHYNVPMTPKIAVWDTVHEMAGLVFYRNFLRVTYIPITEIEPDPLILLPAKAWYHTHALPDDAIRQCCRLLTSSAGTPKWELISQEIIMSLLKLSLIEIKNDTDKNLTKKELTWIRLLNYLQENFTRHLGRDQMARELQLCSGYISELVAEKTGDSFSHLLRKLRMEHAAKLISETDYTLKEITWLSGYQSLTFFCAAFKEYFGKTPSEYRNTL